ncbi:putative zinc-binding protein [Candidatus Pelagadaptatus aseana]|uniref:putative zinc-binding protein n=1 Tax=Candidatus Pelagadaptatus aseana TaxID=3120508 RepID=UPI003C6EC768
MTTEKDEKPLVYACSGCSNVAQTANDMALSMNTSGAAEMSCVAGVGGNVKHMIDKARSGRDIIAIDGCSHHCIKRCLEDKGIEPSFHFELTAMGITDDDSKPVSLIESSKALKTIHMACGLASAYH